MAINNIGGTSNVNVRTHGDHSVGEGDRVLTIAQKGREISDATDVRLTSGTKRLRELESSLGREAAFDAERVEALRAEIKRGDYRIDTKSTASRMLDLERGLFG